MLRVPVDTRAFIWADVVFMGIAKDNHKHDEATFSVEELYKAPENLKYSKEFIVQGVANKTPPDAEVFVFGRLIDHGNSTKLETSACSGTIATPRYQINHLNTLYTQQPDSKETRRVRHIVFTGRAAKASHIEIKPKPSPNVKRQPYVQSTIEFEDIQWLGTEKPAHPDQGGKSFTLNVKECGQQYRVGQQYLVYAHSVWLPDPQPENRLHRKETFSVYCPQSELLNLDTQQILRHLSPIYKEKKDQ